MSQHRRRSYEKRLKLLSDSLTDDAESILQGPADKLKFLYQSLYDELSYETSDIERRSRVSYRQLGAVRPACHELSIHLPASPGYKRISIDGEYRPR